MIATAKPTARGAFTFVLHSHLPYARLAGRWPHGEEWIHEAASETYIPLLLALDELAAEGVDFRLTIGITPVLMEQLADALVQEHLAEFLADKLSRAEADLQRSASAGEEARRTVAGFYQDFYAQLLDAFEHTYHRDILAGFRRLQDRGLIEVITSAATHAYLPLMDRDSTIAAQIRTGVETYVRHMGRRPRSIWLPECAYRPGYTTADGVWRPGIETFLAAEGISCFFSETHLVEGGRPVGKAVGDAVGPYGEITRRYVVPEGEPAPTEGTTFQPYWVRGTEVAVLARNNRTGMQVWSAEHGYPGDVVYREFHKKDGISGLQYWKITGAQHTDLHQKDWYDPVVARKRAQDHARHYAGLVDQLLRDYNESTGEFGIISAAYDTELFGHWWFEGVVWLKHVLRELAATPGVALTTAGAFIEQYPPQRVMDLPAGSWGAGGSDFTWMNADTEWMWPIIHDIERRMEQLSGMDAKGELRAVLDQAAREALLAQSSDWPFLVTTGQAREYAIQRFRSHVDRFNQLADAVQQQAPEGRAALAAELWELDKVFPDIQPAWFAPANQQAERVSIPRQG